MTEIVVKQGISQEELQAIKDAAYRVYDVFKVDSAQSISGIRKYLKKGEQLSEEDAKTARHATISEVLYYYKMGKSYYPQFPIETSEGIICAVSKTRNDTKNGLQFHTYEWEAITCTVEKPTISLFYIGNTRDCIENYSLRDLEKLNHFSDFDRTFASIRNDNHSLMYKSKI